MLNIQHNIPHIIKQFDIYGTYSHHQSYGTGHIHDTFLITTQEENCPNYIMQHINHHVFKNVPLLMHNICRVTSHLKHKLSKIKNADPNRETLTIIPTKEGDLFFLDNADNYWRVYLFIDQTRTFENPKDLAQAREGGKTFGRFLYLISDLDASHLHETIPNFHNLKSRLNIFFETLKKDPEKRKDGAQKEIHFVESRINEMQKILDLGKQGHIPTRVTHNDTKFNNLLFDKNGKAICLTDLDTVMAGYLHYDYSDALRILANTATEDEIDLNKVSFDINLFENFTKGFLESLKDSITPVEIDYLAHSTALLPFMLGLRCLTDYVDGDHYFKIHRLNHNLQRARNQFKLVESIEQQMSALEKIIERLS